LDRPFAPCAPSSGSAIVTWAQSSPVSGAEGGVDCVTGGGRAGLCAQTRARSAGRNAREGRGARRAARDGARRARTAQARPPRPREGDARRARARAPAPAPASSCRGMPGGPASDSSGPPRGGAGPRVASGRRGGGRAASPLRAGEGGAPRELWRRCERGGRQRGALRAPGARWSHRDVRPGARRRLAGCVRAGVSPPPPSKGRSRMEPARWPRARGGRPPAREERGGRGRSLPLSPPTLGAVAARPGARQRAASAAPQGSAALLSQPRPRPVPSWQSGQSALSGTVNRHPTAGGDRRSVSCCRCSGAPCCGCAAHDLASPRARAWEWLRSPQLLATIAHSRAAARPCNTTKGNVEARHYLPAPLRERRGGETAAAGARRRERRGRRSARALHCAQLPNGKCAAKLKAA
jgi:hypothetical protein